MSPSPALLPSFQPSRRDAFRLGLGATALLAGIGVASQAKAMGVTPFVIDLGKGGTGYSSAITVENNFKTPLPVEIRVESLSFDKDGVVESHMDPGDIVIFPTQALIQPGQSRVFRIQYAGSPPTDISKHYYVTAAQVPVDMGSQTTEVQVVYAFNVLVSIPVPGAKADLKALSATIATDPKNPKLFTPVITVENKSITYGYFKDGKLKLTQTDANGKTIFKQTFNADDLAHVVGFGLIGPGQTRNLPFPVPLPSAEGTLKVEYKYAGG